MRYRFAPLIRMLLLVVGCLTVSAARTWAQSPAQTSAAALWSMSGGQSIAYDSARHQAVLFGGLRGRADLLAETWTWDGSSWTQQFPALSPPPRGWASIAYDAARSVVVLFGGFTGTTEAPAYLNDTWTWNGTTWTEQVLAPSPPKRELASMAYDAAHQQVVLFGGRAGSRLNFGAWLSDTWTWDGTSWTLSNPGVSPARRAAAELVFDATNQNVVLFGGIACKPGTPEDYTPRPTPALLPGPVSPDAPFFCYESDETWTWDGSEWSERQSVTRPDRTAVLEGRMAFDAASGKVLLFGRSGYGSGRADHVWMWDGATWTQLTLPAGRLQQGVFVSALVYADALHTVVLFTGSCIQRFANFDNIWTWDGADWASLLPTSPASGPISQACIGTPSD